MYKFIEISLKVKLKLTPYWIRYGLIKVHDSSLVFN